MLVFQGTVGPIVATYKCFNAKLTTAIEWDGAVAVFLVEVDLYVCSAIADFSEAQSSHITPVLEGRADGHLDLGLLHVRCVVVDVVGQTPLSPTTCKKIIHYSKSLQQNLTKSVLHLSVRPHLGGKK